MVGDGEGTANGSSVKVTMPPKMVAETGRDARSFVCDNQYVVMQNAKMICAAGQNLKERLGCAVGIVGGHTGCVRFPELVLDSVEQPAHCRLLSAELSNGPDCCSARGRGRSGRGEEEEEEEEY